jgi:hypothetical protein
VPNYEERLIAEDDFSTEPLFQPYDMASEMIVNKDEDQGRLSSTRRIGATITTGLVTLVAAFGVHSKPTEASVLPSLATRPQAGETFINPANHPVGYSRPKITPEKGGKQMYDLAFKLLGTSVGAVAFNSPRTMSISDKNFVIAGKCDPKNSLSVRSTSIYPLAPGYVNYTVRSCYAVNKDYTPINKPGNVRIAYKSMTTVGKINLAYETSLIGDNVASTAKVPVKELGNVISNTDEDYETLVSKYRRGKQAGVKYVKEVVLEHGQKPKTSWWTPISNSAK